MKYKAFKLIIAFMFILSVGYVIGGMTAEHHEAITNEAVISSVPVSLDETDAVPIARPVSSVTVKPLHAVYYEITAYCANEECCGEWADGITYSGAPVEDGVTIAVDPDVIPLGTRVYIEGVGYRIAQDIGGAVKGHHIDLYFDDYQDALEWGRQTRLVIIYDN